MKQREYPCIVLYYSETSLTYNLLFYKSISQYFFIDFDDEYAFLAERGLKNSFEIKVPFYNEVQS